MMEESAKECVLNYNMYDNFKTWKPCVCVCLGLCSDIQKYQWWKYIKEQGVNLWASEEEGKLEDLLRSRAQHRES